jgi:4-diphosphocytidyl-2-C-methyl-D-erythritol kinase
VQVVAPAKINLCLGVGAVRADGYHPLATVYQALELYDHLEAERVDGRTRVLTIGGSVNTRTVPGGSDNLAVRAVELLAAHHGRELPVGLHLYKGIPVAGGLAGGSADAAAALVAADLLLDLRTPREELLDLAGRLGSDVPFCLVGGTATGSGRGEVVEPVRTAGTSWWVVLPDPEGLSTPAVYAEFDRLTGGSVPAPSVPDELLAALATGDARLLGASLNNDLEPAALSLRPDLADALAAGRTGSGRVPGALGALVSGSGPTTLFLGADEEHARRLAGHLGDVLRRPEGLAPFVVCAPAPGARPVEALPPERGRGTP